MKQKDLMAQFISEHEEHEDIIKAVYNQLGCDDFEEFETHCDDCLTPGGCGANAGFTGFIYYTETTQFYKDNREQILKVLTDLSEGIGDRSILDTVLGFNSLDGNDWETVRAAALTIWGNDDQVDQYVADSLAKFAFEEVANWMSDFMSEHDNEELNDEEE